MNGSSAREWGVRISLVVVGAAAGFWLGQRVVRPWTSDSSPVDQSSVLQHAENAGLNESQSETVLGRKGESASNESVAGRFGLAMLDRSPYRRKARFFEALGTMQPADANQLLELFGRLDRGGMIFPDEWMAFTTRWGEVDGASALAYAASHDSDSWAPSAARRMMEGWASKDPKAAESWLKANEKSPLFDSAFIGFTKGLADQDLDAATRMAQLSVPAGHEAQGGVGEVLAEAAVRHGQLSGLQSWYDGLPDDGAAGDLKRAAFGHVWWRFAHAGDAQGMTWLASQADKPWRIDQYYGEMVGRIANKNPKGAVEWLATLPPSPKDGTWPGTGRAIREWYVRDPTAAGNWVKDAPGPFGDYARSQWQRLIEPIPAAPVAQ
jgi:hypothetical protein